MKFSNKDLLLLFGILVAVIVTLTTMVFSENSNSGEKTTQNSIKPETSLVTPGLIKKAIERIEFNVPVR